MTHDFGDGDFLAASDPFAAFIEASDMSSGLTPLRDFKASECSSSLSGFMTFSFPRIRYRR